MKYCTELLIRLTDNSNKISDNNAVELCDEIENVFCYLDHELFGVSGVTFFKPHDNLFPNFTITLMIFLKLSVTVTARSFSKLKIIFKKTSAFNHEQVI